MKTKLLLYTLLVLVFLTSCSGGSTEPTPTAVDVGAVQTAAVEELMAAITQTAAAFTATPTATEAETPTETPALPTETPTPAGTPTLSTCDAMKYVADVTVQDGSTMAAGQEFIKTWKVKNTGACTWKTNYTIIYAYGDSKMGWQITSLPAEVLANAEVEVSLTLKAPTQPGTYIGWWRLQNNNGYRFGDALGVKIVVP